MNQVFLGKPLHWLFVAVLVGGGWLLGHQRLHVIDFNLFTIVLMVVSAALVLLVLTTSRPDEQVTRDPLEHEDGD
jgi:Zn-dependent protease with chaperone function